MGQYFIIVNIDKKEYINPHTIGMPAKLWEICANKLGGLLIFLLRKSDQTGGGDIKENYEYAGRWAGDRILVIGDYDSSGLYDIALEQYKDISKEVAEEYNDFIELEELKIKIEYIRPDTVITRKGCYKDKIIKLSDK